MKEDKVFRCLYLCFFTLNNKANLQKNLIYSGCIGAQGTESLCSIPVFGVVVDMAGQVKKGWGVCKGQAGGAGRLTLTLETVHRRGVIYTSLCIGQLRALELQRFEALFPVSCVQASQSRCRESGHKSAPQGLTRCQLCDGDIYSVRG